jgi:uncharacterized protein (DUF934 family)
MPILKGAGFAPDPWVHVADDEPLPASGDIWVSFARLERDADALTAFPGQLGAELPNTVKVAQVKPWLHRLALILLPFPAFTDGRAYSLARLIREEGFKGDVRARGAVLPDQLQFMKQVGFTSFEVSDRFSEGVWEKAAGRISMVYQPGYTEPDAARTAVWQARRTRP